MPGPFDLVALAKKGWSLRERLHTLLTKERKEYKRQKGAALDGSDNNIVLSSSTTIILHCPVLHSNITAIQRVKRFSGGNLTANRSRNRTLDAKQTHAQGRHPGVQSSLKTATILKHSVILDFLRPFSDCSAGQQDKWPFGA